LKGKSWRCIFEKALLLAALWRLPTAGHDNISLMTPRYGATVQSQIFSKLNPRTKYHLFFGGGMLVGGKLSSAILFIAKSSIEIMLAI